MLRHRINVGRHHIQRIGPVGAVDFDEYLKQYNMDWFPGQDLPPSAVALADNTALGTGRNEIENPDFEIDASKWNDSGASVISRSTLQAHTGAASGLATIANVNEFVSPDAMPISSASGVFQLSVWVYLDGAGQVGLIGVGGEATVTPVNTTTTGSWVELATTVIANVTGTHVPFAIQQQSGTANFYIDDVFFRQTDIAKSNDFPGPNLLVNPGLPFTFTGDDPDDYLVVGEVAADPEVTERDPGQQNSDTKTVGGAINFFSSSTNFVPQILQGVLTIGTRFIYTTTISKLTSGQLRHGDATSNVAIDVVGDNVLERIAANVNFNVQGNSSAIDVTVSKVSAAKANIINGDYSGVLLGTLAVGTNLGLKPYYVTNDYLDVLSTEKNAKTIPTSYHEMLFIEPTWDATERYILNYYVDANNWIRIIDTSTAGTITWEHRAGGTTESVSLATGSPSGIFPVGISVESGVMKAWYKTGQTGGDQSVAGTFVGNFTQMDIGSDGGASKFFNGFITRIGSKDSELTDAQWLDIYQNSGVS